jgi:hypothetical protein
MKKGRMAMDNFVYTNPIKWLFGKDQINNVAQEILPYGKRILLVYGRKHIKETGVYDRITKLLKEAGIEWIDLEGVQPNPRLELAQKGIEICKNENIEFILGVGGGSTSDTAKTIGMGAKVDYNIWEAYEDFHNIIHGNEGDFWHIPTECLPVGVVMTKAGTGSEFDYTSVLSNRKTLEKLMIINKVMYPKFAIDDPSLTYTLPPEEISFGIADIMSHILELYFSHTKNTILLDRMKESLLKTVIESAPKALDNPKDYDAQSNLLYAAAWACSEQNVVGLTSEWAAHMIEHEITAITDLNHGHGMAIVYIAWMKYALETFPEKFARVAEVVWGVKRKGRSDIEVGMEGIEKMREFLRSLGIPLTLKEAGVDPSLLPRIAKQAVRFGPIGTSKLLYEEDVLKILESAMGYTSDELLLASKESGV